MLVITPEYFYIRELKNVLVSGGRSQDAIRISKRSVRECEKSEPDQKILPDYSVNEARDPGLGAQKQTF